VTAFDVVATTTRIDIVARDAAEAREGAGSRLLLVALEGDRALAPQVLVGEGVGRGDPVVLGVNASRTTEGDAAGADITGAVAVFYVDPFDRSRFLPLDPLGPPSVEPALEGARVLLRFAPTEKSPVRLAQAAFSHDGGAPARGGTALLVAQASASADEHARLKLAHCGP
jgi:hypothetical protein